MNIDFVLPLYFKDLIQSTQDFSDEEFGAYLRLLIHQWSKGSIPSDANRLNRIAHTSEKNWELLKGKFQPSGENCLQNTKMEEIRKDTTIHQQKKSVLWG